jgi:tetratricopeptide (TPR) repeat protein
MQFMRRPDLDSVSRLNLAIQAYLALGVYGEITRLATVYRVSRLFVYQLLWQLQALFAMDPAGGAVADRERPTLDRLILLLRLQGRCSLGNISEILRQLGYSIYSVGYISERILAYARTLPADVPAGLQITFYLSDEIYSGSRPILITVDARSLAILKIELADRRDGAQWQAHWQALRDAGYLEAKYVVSDLGTGLVKGCALYGIIHHPDLFHLVQPIRGFAARFERQAYAAIAAEEQRQKVWGNAQAEAVRKKKRALYKKAQAEAAAAIERYDNFCYLWRPLKSAFDLFDTAGQCKDPARNLAEVLAILELMKSLGCESLNQELATLEKALPAYWDYFYRAAKSYQALAQIYPADALAAVSLAWQYGRQAKNSKCYAVQQSLHGEAQFYLQYAQAIDPERFAALQARVFADFDANIRSSSLIENVNSLVRPFLETSRGQVTQETLNLVAYFHNHRRFVRGQRRNYAPMELLTGEPLKTSWVDALLEAVH